MNATYPAAATTPVRISEIVTGLTLLAIGNIGAPIVTNALDDDRRGKERCERSYAERPSARHIGPPVDAQVYAGEADDGAQRQRGDDEGRTLAQPAEHPRNDHRERHVHRRVGRVPARVRL